VTGKWVSNVIANIAINASMTWNQYRLRRPLLRAAQNTESSQQALLQRILQHNANTDFGRQFDFATIKTMAEYRDRVPVQTYDTLAPYIEKQINGDQALTIDPPKYYARTSGTTGGYKNIPLTANGLLQVQHAQKQLALTLWRDTDFLTGSVLGFASAVEEGKLENGRSYGAVSGSTYRSISPIVASKFVLPRQVFAFKDAEAKYQAYALATLASDNLTGIVAANPSSILKLVRMIEKNTDNLLQILAGNLSQWQLPETATIAPQLINSINKNRLEHLVHSYTKHGRLTPNDVFPVLSAIATWTGGSCGIALRQLKSYLPVHKNTDVKIVEYGYGSSEFMGTVNIDAINNRCLPQLTHHVFEFVKRRDWSSPGADKSGTDNNIYYGAHELIPGEEYYAIVTTQSGLYRYNINDIVRADSAIGAGPSTEAGPSNNLCATISFLQKGQGVTNITGEKLSEHQLINAMSDTIQTHNIAAGGYMALANEEQSRYDIYLELDKLEPLRALSDKLDKQLCTLNVEYNDKRASGRLKHVQMFGLSSDACDVIKGWCVAQGVREAQYKPTVLAYARDWAEKLKPLLLKDLP